MNGPVPGLDGIRDEMEHNPRNPFAGNTAAILAELGPAWTEYLIAYDGGYWTASRRDGTGKPLRELSPDELIAAMRDAR